MNFLLSHLDYGLSITTLFILWLTGKKSIWAPIGGMANNVLWIIYALVIHQYGLTILSASMLVMYGWMLFKWTREPQVTKVWVCPHGHTDDRDCPDCCH